MHMNLFVIKNHQQQFVLFFPQGNKWWMNADEPWQALACCMEIANAVRSPDPPQFISHFPVHQVKLNTWNDWYICSHVLI